jgi:hypothetical protein
VADSATECDAVSGFGDDEIRTDREDEFDTVARETDEEITIDSEDEFDPLAGVADEENDKVVPETDSEARSDTVIFAEQETETERLDEIVRVCGRAGTGRRTGGATGRHKSPLPPALHEQTGVARAVVKLMLHALPLMVRGAKQSALTLHDPQAPADTTARESQDNSVTIPLWRLQRS